MRGDLRSKSHGHISFLLTEIISCLRELADINVGLTLLEVTGIQSNAARCEQ